MPLAPTPDFPLQNQSSDAESSHHEPPHFGQHPPGIGFEDGGGPGEVDDEEDYSISVSAIMQRRASVRGYRGKRGSRSSRRASSPMDHVLDSVERRRSSVYTTSSGKCQSAPVPGPVPGPISVQNRFRLVNELQSRRRRWKWARVLWRQLINVWGPVFRNFSCYVRPYGAYV